MQEVIRGMQEVQAAVERKDRAGAFRSEVETLSRLTQQLSSLMSPAEADFPPESGATGNPGGKGKDKDKREGSQEPQEGLSGRFLEETEPGAASEAPE